jgi:hypothetical protein
MACCLQSVLYNQLRYIPHFTTKVKRPKMKHAAIECLSSFQNSLSLNRSKDLLILGTGIAGLYLVGQIYVSYKKAQRR